MSRPTAIDPAGCGCTECLTGEYVPLDRTTAAQVADMLTGRTVNNTGGKFSTRVVIREEYSGLEWGLTV